MARAKRTVDKEEVEEIINLKLEELGGRKNKLTANGLAKFSRKIANNEEYTRSNGSLFNYYGYDFWASDYKGEDYYGKKRLAEIKNSVEVHVAGKDFLPEVQDIILLVDKYHKEPEILSKKLSKVFESDKKKITKLTDEISQLKEEKDKLKNNLDDFKRGFATLFLNSNSTDNSLNDVLSVPRLRDGNVSAELQNMFKEEYKEVVDTYKNAAIHTKDEKNNVSDITKLTARRERRRGL